ncbi:MAG: ImmA/IrrE family metallo-endopeptidase [Chloroflexi bacterium]|nr:ImmA/IrrE family metallo-endopeptidase [Chloroflexota bacterium]
MREYPDRGGRLPYRLWYDETEIEDICRRELEIAGWPLLGAGPAVDVDTFIERRLGVAPDFVWLPRDVLGATEFGAKGEVHVQVSAELALRADRDPGAERLLRSTLAHEAAHVLLHRTLFLRESRSLFGGLAARTELCRSVSVPAPGYTGEWWEWQANRGMAALLLPAELLRAWLADHGYLSPTAAGDSKARALPKPAWLSVAARQAAAKVFGVSADSVKRRLVQLEALAHVEVASARP